MTRDLYVNTDGQIEYDNFGDYRTTSGDDNVRQQVRLAIQRGLGGVTVDQLTEQRKRTIRRDIRTALDANPYVDRIVAVELRTPTDETIEIVVRTQSDDIGVPFDR